MFERASIGGLLLEETDGWVFTADEGVVVGRFRDDLGVLLITAIAANELPHPVTHEACLARAAELGAVADTKPSDWKTLQSVTGPYGSANFERGSDRVYCSYCCRAPGLIVGSYCCRADQAGTYENRGLRMQCNRMITTALFDRRSWGADDEITQLLISLLGADDAMQAPYDENPG